MNNMNNMNNMNEQNTLNIPFDFRNMTPERLREFIKTHEADIEWTAKAYYIAATILIKLIASDENDEALKRNQMTAVQIELIKSTIVTNIAPALRQIGANLKEGLEKGKALLRYDDKTLSTFITGVNEAIKTQAPALESESESEIPHLEPEELISYLTPEEQQVVFVLNGDLVGLMSEGKKEEALALSIKIMQINNKAVMRMIDARKPLPEEIEHDLLYCDLSNTAVPTETKRYNLNVEFQTIIGSPLYEDLVRLVHRYTDDAKGKTTAKGNAFADFAQEYFQ